MSSARWLVTKELVKEDGEMVFEDGISRFCPEHSKILGSPSRAPVCGASYTP
ncbi:hypothetical protein [Kitasatospora sp. NPDC088346]|uniref:hypothetical protein n=1 Tax=Kitasatospora sp. NPDC088346 TaxID=3364073 RepID=UPI00380E4369